MALSTWRVASPNWDMVFNGDTRLFQTKYVALILFLLDSAALHSACLILLIFFAWVLWTRAFKLQLLL